MAPADVIRDPGVVSCSSTCSTECDEGMEAGRLIWAVLLDGIYLLAVVIVVCILVLRCGIDGRQASSEERT
eukprot:9679689-Prorocentrum_lima.AAC.1